MLDDSNVLRQRDPGGALDIAATQWEQTRFAADVRYPDHDGRPITKVVVTGMGGSALAAELVKVWLAADLSVPFEVVRDYSLPTHVDYHTLVIASSFSGNTEETLSAVRQALERGSAVAIIAQGGALQTLADEQSIASVFLPSDLPVGFQPRMAVIYGLRALTALLAHFGVVPYERYGEIADTGDWLREQTAEWQKETSTDKNYAKQLALLAVGKTPVIYGGPLTAPVAYKWKISWNENAKNVAFWNQYPEFNHNEYMGWTSHPVEKPFVIFDLMSYLEHPQVVKRFSVSDRLLSGKRPKANEVNLVGSSLLEQLLWGSILADFTSCYVAVLNGVDPLPVAAIEEFKRKLNED